MSIPKTLVDYQEMASGKGWEYILDFIPANTFIHVEGWTSPVGHLRNSNYNNIRDLKHCSVCYGKLPKTLPDYQELGRLRGGEYNLATIQNNANTPIKGWKCEKGHIWSARYTDINQGSWCPVCREPRGERELRILLDVITPGKFDKLRIPGTRYEFDFGSSTDKLLIEFDGNQHFEAVDFFGGEEALIANQSRDVLKTQWALDNGYRLLRIDYTNFDHISTH